MPSPKSQAIGEEFKHLITHALSYTLESEDVSVMGYGGLKLGSLDEVIKVEDLVCFNEGMRRLEDDFDMCLEQGKNQGGPLLEQGSSS